MNKLPYKYNLGDLVKLKEEEEIGMIANRTIFQGYSMYQVHWAYWGPDKRWLFSDDIEKVEKKNV
jgi:hypothetical protein